MDENNQGLQWSHIEPLCILRALARQPGAPVPARQQVLAWVQQFPQWLQHGLAPVWARALAWTQALAQGLQVPVPGLHQSSCGVPARPGLARPGR